MSETDFVYIGKITGSFGVRGGLRVLYETDFPERFSEGGKVRLELKKNLFKEFTIEKILKKTDIGCTLKFEEISSLTDAEPLIGKQIIIPSSERRQLAAGEYYPDEIKGCVVEYDGRSIGVVNDVIENSQYYLLEIDDGHETKLVPFLEKFVLSIDKAGKKAVITELAMELIAL